MWKYNQTLPNELYHFGIKGMRWGHRKPEDEINRERRRQSENDYEYREKTTQEKHQDHLREYGQQQSEIDEAQRAANRRKVMIGVAAVAALGLAAYGISRSRSSQSDGKSSISDNKRSGSSSINKFKSLGDKGSGAEGGKLSITGNKRSGSASTNLFQLIGDVSSMSGGKLPNARSKGKLTRKTVRKAPTVIADTPVKGIADDSYVSSIVEKLLYGHPRSKPAK